MPLDLKETNATRVPSADEGTETIRRVGSSDDLRGLPDANRGDVFYDEFYKSGGWRYSFWREYWWHRRHVVKRFKLRRGARILEVACGSGFHTNLLNRMGYACTGVDRSEAGIRWARLNYPRWQYLCADALQPLPLPACGFDVVLTRGCSHYHYDLAADIANQTTARLLDHLKPGGVFILIIATDQSGRRDPGRIWQNRLDDYGRHFARFGRRHSVDWFRGMAICGLWKD